MPSVVITGASRGLGYAFLKHYSSLPNYTVIGIVRNAPAAQARVAKDNLPNVHVLQADTTDATAIQAAADATTKITGGRLDLLINNAALSANDASAFINVDALRPEQAKQYLSASFEANVIGVALTTNAFLPLIRAGAAKKVITISTGMADAALVTRFDVANAAAYAVSKAGANMLVAKYHASLGRSEGILFLAISPGFVDTDESGQPPSPEAMKGAQEMARKFADYAPDFKGPITPRQSVEMVGKVIEGATVEVMGGKFVSHFGDKQWL